MVKYGYKVHFVHIKNGKYTSSQNLTQANKLIPSVTFTNRLEVINTNILPQGESKLLKTTFTPERYHHNIEEFTKGMAQLAEEQKCNYSIGIIQIDKVDSDEFKLMQKDSISKRLPIVFKEKESGAISIFGYSTNDKWEIQELKVSKLDIQFEPNLKVLTCKQVPKELYQAINAKGAHLTTTKQLSNHVVLDYKIIEKMLLQEKTLKDVIGKYLNNSTLMVDQRRVGLKPSLLDPDEDSFIAQDRRRLLNIYGYVFLVHAKVIKHNRVQFGIGKEIKCLPYHKITETFQKSHMRFAKDEKDAMKIAMEIRVDRTVNTSTLIIGYRDQEQLIIDEVTNKEKRNGSGHRSHFERAEEIVDSMATKQVCVAVSSVVYISENKFSFINAPKNPTSKKFIKAAGHLMYSIWGNGKDHFIHHLEGTFQTDAQRDAILKDFQPIVDTNKQTLGYVKLKTPVDDAMMELVNNTI